MKKTKKKARIPKIKSLCQYCGNASHIGYCPRIKKVVFNEQSFIVKEVEFFPTHDLDIPLK